MSFMFHFEWHLLFRTQMWIEIETHAGNYTTNTVALLKTVNLNMQNNWKYVNL
jgi:hypothetical protein